MRGFFQCAFSCERHHTWRCSENRRRHCRGDARFPCSASQRMRRTPSAGALQRMRGARSTSLANRLDRGFASPAPILRSVAGPPSVIASFRRPRACSACRRWRCQCRRRVPVPSPGAVAGCRHPVRGSRAGRDGRVPSPHPKFAGRVRQPCVTDPSELPMPHFGMGAVTPPQLCAGCQRSQPGLHALVMHLRLPRVEFYSSARL